MRNPVAGPARARSVLSRGDLRQRSLLAALGMLLAVFGALPGALGTTALATAPVGQPHDAAASLSAYSVAVDGKSGISHQGCAKRATRTDGPDDHKFRTPQNQERATSRRVVDHQVDVAEPSAADILLPVATVRDDPPDTEDNYGFRAYRTVDGRAPPRARA
ncbi:MAG: hypothetical protein GEU97_06465 [Actinophytocola sp.]|nr:hypothetical protein [Actinophytocola sp.]